MTNNAITILQLIFGSAWNLLTSFYIPGTNVTPAGLAIFIPTTYIGLKFLKYLFGRASGNIDFNIRSDK